jgi:hypothetical protein
MERNEHDWSQLDGMEQEFFNINSSIVCTKNDQNDFAKRTLTVIQTCLSSHSATDDFNSMIKCFVVDILTCCLLIK